MNTDKIKNIIIAALSGLIILFVALIYFDEQVYVLSAAQEENITFLLEQNDFLIASSASLPRYFSPMRQANMQHYNHDVHGMALRFFGEIQFKTDIEIGSTFYYCDVYEKEIGIELATNTINFSSFYGFFVAGHEDGFVHNAINSINLAYAFIHEVIGTYNMVHHSTSLTANGDYIVVFYARHDGRIVFNNHVRVRVSGEGITHVVYSKMTVGDFFGEERPIFSADEALMALIFHLRSEHEYHQIIAIVDLQLVYAHADRGVPAYLITVVIGGVFTFNYLFNAFTNTHIWSEIVF